MKPLRIWVWLVAALALFSGSFAYTYSRLSTNQSARLSGANDAVKRLNANAAVVLRYVLSDGRRGSELHLDTVPADLVGVSLAEARTVYPDWSIIRFDADELIADVRCTAHTGGFLGIRDGRLAVYDGVPGPCSVLKEQTDIPLESVRPEERSKLEQGLMTFENEDNLQELLDGLVID